MRLVSLILSIFFLCISCDKLDENYNKIPEDAPRLTELQQEYQDILVGNEDGWFIEYQPGSNNPAVSIWMNFLANGKVHILSDRFGFDDEKVATYRIAGVIGPELIFDTYSVWSAIAESGGGAFDFRMYPQDNGDFTLKHAIGGLETEFLLRKAQSSDRDDIMEKASVGRLLHAFSENATAYFRNLILDNITAFWDIDINTQQVTLTWENSTGDGTTTETFSYSTLPGNGIRLAQEWQPNNNIEVQEIFFGDPTPNGIEIVNAGNAGAGEIEVAHVPAFPYPGTAKRFILSNSFNPNQDPVRFFANTSVVSEALMPYYSKLFDVWTASPAFVRIQIYNYNGSNPVKTNSIQLFGSGPNTWLPYYYVLEEADESHVLTIKRDQVDPSHPQYGNYASGTALTFLQNNPEVADVLDKIYPPEGVTIVPLSGQNVRVVSRANSLYWIDLTISTPATFWSN